MLARLAPGEYSADVNTCQKALPSLLALTLLLSCELAESDPDVKTDLQPADTSEVPKEEVTPPPEDTASPEPDPVTGCEWAAGEWSLTDCEGSVIALTINLVSGCAFQVVSTATTLTGAWGTVKDAGLSMLLPMTNSQCHASYDGVKWVGACGMPAGPCAFQATRP